MAPSRPSNLFSCCWRCIAGELRPAAQPQSRRSLVTIQRGPVQKLDLPPAVPQNFWSQLPARLRPDRRQREIVVHKPPASEREACKEPIKLVDGQQLSRLDPTGARSKLFDPANEHRAKPGDILLATFTSGEPFAGIVVAVKGSGPHKSVLLRNHLTRIGTEMLIKIHSPLVQSIEIAKRGTKRRKRARLYYLRQPKHDIGSVQGIVDQYLRERRALTGKQHAHRAAHTDTSHVGEPQDSKLAGNSPDFLTSEPIRVTFEDNSTVFYVQKEIMRRFLAPEADPHSWPGQAEIRLGAVPPGVVSTLIRAFYSPTPHHVDLGLPSLSPSGVLDIYAAATQLGRHQWIRMACLKELESRPILLTEFVAEFQVLYGHGHADREARDMFKRLIARELERGWPVDFLSQFLAGVSRKGGELTADLVEAVVEKRLLEENGSIPDDHPSAPPASEALKTVENDDRSRQDPAWWRRAGTSDASSPVAPMAEDTDSDNGVCLDPAADWHQTPRQRGHDAPSMVSVARARSASETVNHGLGLPTESREASQDVYDERERSIHDRRSPHAYDGLIHGRAVASPNSSTRGMPQLAATCATPAPPFILPSGPAEPGWARSRVAFGASESSQPQVDAVAASRHQHELNQPPSPMPPPTAPPHPGEGQTEMPHCVPNLGYNHVVSIGNGMIHPTSLGMYGLAGRAMVATRDSGFDCSLFFRAGDVISNVVTVLPGLQAYPKATDARPIPLDSAAGHSGVPPSASRPGIIAYLQGICRGRAGRFPASYVRDMDPPVLRADVVSMLTETRTLFSSYLRIRSLATGKARSEELVQTRKDVEANLGALAADVQDLVGSIAAVERDPYAFGIDTAEVQRRRQFVRDVSDEVSAMQSELVDGSGQSVAAAARGALPPPNAFDNDDDAATAAADQDPDAYAAFEHQQQQTILAEQDQQLDGVYRSVGVLRGQAEDMGRELEEQGFLIDEVDTLADRVGGKLQAGVKKVGDVIRKNEDSMSSCCIAVLIVVLIILLILVIVI
ncbi:hypothetical protein DV737_g4763, partial [Chaetothyriales sp. CBS 132003]